MVVVAAGGYKKKKRNSFGRRFVSATKRLVRPHACTDPTNKQSQMHTNEQSKCEAFDMNQKVKSKRKIKIEFYMKKKHTFSLLLFCLKNFIYIFIGTRIQFVSRYFNNNY